MFSTVRRLIERTVGEFMKDDCPALAAALAYYTIFSLPPLLVIVITVAGFVFGEAAIRGEIRQQIGGLTGPAAAAEVERMIRAARQESQTSAWATAVGIGALVFAATTAFAFLQSSLNRVWEVRPDPQMSTIREFLTKRVLSFGMILGISFLLLVSLILSAVLSAFGDRLTAYLPAGLSAPLLQAFNTGISFVVITLLFAAMYKILPDAKIEWRDVGIGATVTAALFVVGKSLVGVYLGNSSVTSTYGAAGSLVVILLWTYYSSMILLLGAEFTQIWSEAHGKGIQPEKGAVRVVAEEHVERGPRRARGAA